MTTTDVARVLDSLSGLHLRPGHLDTVLEVIALHAPVKVPLSGDARAETAHYANGVADLAMKHRDAAEARCADLEAKVARLRAALEDIAEPLVQLQAEANAQGARLNGGGALMLATDAHWLRDKARAAFRETDTGNGDHTNGR